MIRRSLQTLLILALGSVVLPAAADTVHLANGDRLTGTVRSIDGSAVVVNTDWAGTVVVDREAVRAVESEQPFNLSVDGETVRGARLALADSGEQLVIDESGQRETGFGLVERASIDVLRSRPEDEWATNITYGLNISTGNSETLSHALRAKSTLRREKARHNGRFEVDRETDDGTVTKDQLRLGYQLDWFFRDDWYSYGSGEYFKDDLKDVDYRFTVGAGVGHQFWENSLGGLDAEVGASAVIEEIGGEQEENPALRLALDYNRFLIGRQLELFHNSEVLALTDFDRGQIFNASTGLRLAMSKMWSADLRVDVSHETEPADDQKKTDVTYILGVGFDF